MSRPILRAIMTPGAAPIECTIADILDAHYGAVTGQFLERTTQGWGTIALPHFTVKNLLGVTSTSGGGLLGFIPNEGNPVIYTYIALYVVTKSTGAATLNIGVGTNTTTSANNLITACDVGTNSAVPFDNITDIGASGKSRQLATGVQALTVTGTADTTGFVGILFAAFIKATPTGM